MLFTVFITKISQVDFIRANSTTLMIQISIQVHNFLNNNTYQLPSTMFNRLFQKIQNTSEDQKVEFLLSKRHYPYNFTNSTHIFPNE